MQIRRIYGLAAAKTASCLLDFSSEHDIMNTEGVPFASCFATCAMPKKQGKKYDIMNTEGVQKY